MTDTTSTQPVQDGNASGGGLRIGNVDLMQLLATGMKGEVVHFTKDGYDIYFEPIRISKFNYDAV